MRSVLLNTATPLLLATHKYEGIQVELGLRTFNFTGIKRDASMAVPHAVVSGKCVLLLTGSAHVTGQSRDR
jgi:hypothetical protein